MKKKKLYTGLFSTHVFFFSPFFTCRRFCPVLILPADNKSKQDKNKTVANISPCTVHLHFDLSHSCMHFSGKRDAEFKSKLVHFSTRYSFSKSETEIILVCPIPSGTLNFHKLVLYIRFTFLLNQYFFCKSENARYQK